jgi:hypothetical protein
VNAQSVRSARETTCARGLGSMALDASGEAGGAAPGGGDFASIPAIPHPKARCSVIKVVNPRHENQLLPDVTAATSTSRPATAA